MTQKEGYKLCPYCSEEIREEAIKCRHCKSVLTQEPSVASRAAKAARGKLATVAKIIGKFGFKRGLLVVAVVLFVVIIVTLFNNKQPTGLLKTNKQPIGALKWKYKTDANVHSSPAVSGGVVYVGSSDYHLYALNAESGALKWKYETGMVSSFPAVSRGVVYVGSGDDGFGGYLYALN